MKQLEQKRYFNHISLTSFNCEGVKVDYPRDVYKIYFSQEAPKYIQQIISKWEKGRELTERDYQQLLKKMFAHIHKRLDMPPADADLPTLCGVAVLNGKLIIREEAKGDVETKAMRFCLEQILRPYTTPIIKNYFPGLAVNLGIWHDPIGENNAELDQTVKMAYIFTLYNYLWSDEIASRYNFFLDYYQTELAKRLGFIKRLWENRRPGEGLEYIPIFEDFRNFNPEKGALVNQVVTRILKSQDLQASERKFIEEALINHAKKVLMYRDEEATKIKDSILNPLVSEMVSLNKSREFIQAAEVCFDQGLHNSCINRAYYAMLRAARAALVHNGLCKSWRSVNLRPIETHEEVINTFEQVLVGEKGLFPPEMVVALRKAYQQRLIADYADQETEERIAAMVMKKAQLFITMVGDVVG
ncbi:MAG: HEPN domain-containing protein [Clostridia bacterium]|nr:HEPN domain-containing protein [Clostridia bacterium]